MKQEKPIVTHERVINSMPEEMQKIFWELHNLWLLELDKSNKEYAAEMWNIKKRK